jgi:hypothetical protein
MLIPQIGFDRVKNIYSSIFKDGFRIPIFLYIHNGDPKQFDSIKTITGCDSWSSSEGVWINNQLISNRFSDGFEAGKFLIFNDRVEKGLVVMTDFGVKAFGLPLDIFDTVFVDIELDEDMKKILLGQNIIKLNG